MGTQTFRPGERLAIAERILVRSDAMPTRQQRARTTRHGAAGTCSRAAICDASHLLGRARGYVATRPADRGGCMQPVHSSRGRAIRSRSESADHNIRIIPTSVAAWGNANLACACGLRRFVSELKQYVHRYIYRGMPRLGKPGYPRGAPLLQRRHVQSRQCTLLQSIWGPWGNRASERRGRARTHRARPAGRSRSLP